MAELMPEAALALAHDTWATDLERRLLSHIAALQAELDKWKGEFERARNDKWAEFEAAESSLADAREKLAQAEEEKNGLAETLGECLAADDHARDYECLWKDAEATLEKADAVIAENYDALGWSSVAPLEWADEAIARHRQRQTSGGDRGKDTEGGDEFVP